MSIKAQLRVRFLGGGSSSLLG